MNGYITSSVNCTFLRQEKTSEEKFYIIFIYKKTAWIIDTRKIEHVQKHVGNNRIQTVSHDLVYFDVAKLDKLADTK